MSALEDAAKMRQVAKEMAEAAERLGRLVTVLGQIEEADPGAIRFDAASGNTAEAWEMESEIDKYLERHAERILADLRLALSDELTNLRERWGGLDAGRPTPNPAPEE
jgi:hypothetical protein